MLMDSIKHGNLRPEIKFGQALPVSIAVIVDAEFYNIDGITTDRHQVW